MVRKSDASHRNNYVKADIIVLGCSLPGIVAAHKLQKKFGDTMDIVVLNLISTPKPSTKSYVAFQEDDKKIDVSKFIYDKTARDVIDNVARFYLNIYAQEFNIPLPEAIMNPQAFETSLSKLFEYRNGTVVKCSKNLQNFDYLNLLERFELNQYHALLEQSMKDLFQANKINDDSERRLLLSYDRTNMEKHICNGLLFQTSRDIMRNTVRLVCGVAPNQVSVLFYLHQCYRTSSSRNHIDGNNTRIREKLLGYCAKHIASKLQKSIANITLSIMSIKEISSYSGEKVILKTFADDKDYVCNLLAMALKPDELSSIHFESQLVSEIDTSMFSTMKKGKAKKFVIQYEENFWRKDGYSGDIFSIRGPIMWATERPKLSSEGSVERYAALIGYLKVETDNVNTRESVINQLVGIFGEEAANPFSYREKDISDIYVPRCGDFIALRRLVEKPKHNLEWAALDVFADGDVAAALEAGHSAYLQVLRFLRPQAQSFEDLRTANWPTLLNENGPLTRWIKYVNITSTMRAAIYVSVAYAGYRIVRHLRK